MVAQVVATYGKIDVLVNNAGGGIAIKEVADFSIEEIDATIKLNLNSVIYGCRAFADMMKQQNSGTNERLYSSFHFSFLLFSFKVPLNLGENSFSVAVNFSRQD